MNERSCRLNDIENRFDVIFLFVNRISPKVIITIEQVCAPGIKPACGTTRCLIPQTHKGHPKVAFAWCNYQLSARLT